MGAAEESDELIETARIGMVSVIVAQMPFAKHSGGVPCFLEELREHHDIVGHSSLIRGPAARRFLAASRLAGATPHSGFERVEAGHDRRTRRRAERVDAELRETNSVSRNLVHERRLQVCFPVAAAIA